MAVRVSGVLSTPVFARIIESHELQVRGLAIQAVKLLLFCAYTTCDLLAVFESGVLPCSPLSNLLDQMGCYVFKLLAKLKLLTKAVS